MTLTITIYAEFPNADDYSPVDVDVIAVYGDHGIGSYEYAGIYGRDVQMGWEIEDWHWDKSLYTAEQNDIINEACYAEQSYFIEKFEQERLYA